MLTPRLRIAVDQIEVAKFSKKNKKKKKKGKWTNNNKKISANSYDSNKNI